MATLSNWSENLPSDSSLVIKAPGYARSIWRDITIGLSESLFWPGSGGASNASQGDLREGTARAFHGTESTSSFGAAATHQGRLFLTSDTSRLFAYDSANTVLLGSAYFVESALTFPNAVWVQANGSYATNTGGTFVAGDVSLGITYDNTGYSVYLVGGSINHRFQAIPDATTTFQSNVSGPTGSQTYRWVSIGTVTVT